MEKYYQFARAFFLEAKKDFERAKKMLELKDYPACVFYCQQTTEKAVKAMLETKFIYIKEHSVLPYFIKEFQNEWKEEYNEIVKALDYFEGEWAFTRYPRLIKGKVVLPEEEYTEEDAKLALEYAKKVLEIVEKYLKEKSII